MFPHLLSFLAAAARPAKGRVFPSEVHAYRDALTEFVVERLTNPDFSAWLPGPHCRAVSRRAAFLVYGSDRDGSPQLYRLDHRSGTSLQLTEAAVLDRSRFTLLPGDRSLLYVDGPVHRTLDKFREREVYRVRDGWKLAPGLSGRQRRCTSPQAIEGNSARLNSSTHRNHLFELTEV